MPPSLAMLQGFSTIGRLILCSLLCLSISIVCNKMYCIKKCSSSVLCRCQDANLMNMPVEIETPDRHYYHVAFFTNRKVKAREELTWDYGIDFEDNEHPVPAFICLCGSDFCRGYKML